MGVLVTEVYLIEEEVFHISSSAHADNKKKDILVLGTDPTQGLEQTLTVEKMYSINFTVTNIKFCLSLH